MKRFARCSGLLVDGLSLLTRSAGRPRRFRSSFAGDEPKLEATGESGGWLVAVIFYPALPAQQGGRVRTRCGRLASRCHILLHHNFPNR